jgi:hypothetical protein
VLTTPGQHFDLHANAAKITDIEIISLASAGGATMTMTGADIAQVNASGSLLYVVGGYDDEIRITDPGWSLVSTTNANAAVDPSVNFIHYQHTSGVDLFLDDRFTFPVSWDVVV